MRSKYKVQLLIFAYTIAIIYGSVVVVSYKNMSTNYWLMFFGITLLSASIMFIGVRKISNKAKKDPAQ